MTLNEIIPFYFEELYVTLCRQHFEQVLYRVTIERSRLLKFCLVAAMNIMCTSFCDVMPFSLVDVKGLRTFGRTRCIHVHDMLGRYARVGRPLSRQGRCPGCTTRRWIYLF